MAGVGMARNCLKVGKNSNWHSHHTLWWWCLAAETCIFTVVTVMHTNAIVEAVYKSSLPAVANQLIQKNWTSALAKGGISKCLCT